MDSLKLFNLSDLCANEGDCRELVPLAKQRENNEIMEEIEIGQIKPNLSNHNIILPLVHGI